MASHPDENPAPVWPKISEAEWYFLAILVTLFTVVAAGFAATWVFDEQDLDKRAKMVTSLAPFGAIPLAMITFCTVAWRGMVTARQADQQQRQNDASDDANFAKLLQEGAKLVAEEKTPNQLAGIASLNILLTEPKARYANEARDVLAEGMKSLFKVDVDSDHVREVSSTSVYSALQTLLTREGDAGRYSSVTIKLKASYEFKAFTTWPHFKGFNSCTITGGSVQKAEQLFAGNRSVSLRNMNVSNSTCEVSWDKFTNCEFRGCKITKYDDHSYLPESYTFTKCNFSGCEFDSKVSPKTLEDTKFEACWFDIENPPNLDPIADFVKFFAPRLRIANRWVTIREINDVNPVLSEKQQELVMKYREKDF